MTDDCTPVLVVGGGLAGLSAAVFLAWRGVPTVVVERHPGSSAHPRAIGYTQRTLELYRAVGLNAQIPQGQGGGKPRRARVESLAGQWFEESAWTPPSPGKPKVEYSPSMATAIAQDRLEPVLRDKAVELGAEIRLSTELTGFEQDTSGVTATLRPQAGADYRLRAQYLVAADGFRSPVRESLGIGRSGAGPLAIRRSVLFSAPLDEYLEKGISQFDIDQPGLEAFLTTYRDGRWVLMFGDDVPRDEDALRAMVVQAIGRSDRPIDLITTGRWELSALIADRFASGRVFLAGDAAHTLPPNRGGYGANTGIEDVHNLAWKLSSVLSGQSSSQLLGTYDAERRPIAWLRHQQIFARADFKVPIGSIETDAPIIDDDAMELGQLYRSTAVLGAGPELAPARRPDEWAGQPGTRAPHAWLTGADQKLSTLDLFERTWVLLAGDLRWAPAIAAATRKLGITVKFVRIGLDGRPAVPDTYRTALGLQPGGASLVRPDGYIAWRSIDWPADPADALTGALAEVSSVTDLPVVRGTPPRTPLLRSCSRPVSRARRPVLRRPAARCAPPAGRQPG
jgi:putative polyketide hydroxylase